nr:MAG TPA: hypothetical protein [Caudoviricetes sp.]
MLNAHFVGRNCLELKQIVNIKIYICGVRTAREKLNVINRAIEPVLF